MIVVRFMGQIERGGPYRGYRWVDGYAVIYDDKTEYPWGMRRETVTRARRYAKERNRGESVVLNVNGRTTVLVAAREVKS